MLEQLPNSVGELRVEVARESRPGIVGKDSHEHEGIVLPRWCSDIVLLEELADESCALCGRGRGGFGSVDNGREEKNLVALYVGTVALG